MKAMILAAGYGKRFAPFTSFLPKPLIPFANRPLIEYTFNFLKKNNITEVVINTHHLTNVITNYLGDGSQYGITIHYSNEPEILGTAGGIKAAEKILCNDTFLVINGDIVFDIDLASALRFHNNNRAIATLLLREDQKARQYGLISVNQHGQIGQFLNTLIPGKREKLLPAMFTGIHIIEPAIFDYIPSHRFCGITEEIYPYMVKNNKLFGYITTGYWMDIGHHENYLKAHWDALDGKYELAWKKTVHSKTIIGSNCAIEEGSHVNPYTIIGNNCMINDNSIVKKSVLWDNVCVKGSLVYNCIVGTGVTVKNMEIENKVVTEKDGKVYIAPL